MPRVLKLFSLLKGLIKNDFQMAAGLMGEMHGLPQKLGQHFTLYPGQQYQEYFDKLCTGGKQEDIQVGEILNSLGIGSHNAEVYAQASIGQVYRVETDTGEFAVKVRYPGVEKRITADFKLLKTLLWPVKFTPLKNNALIPLLENLQVTLLDECNYEKEARIQDSFSRLFGKEETVFVPELVASNKKAIVTGWVNGHSLTDGKVGLGAWFIDAYLHFVIKSLKQLKMIHADPHPGNFILMEGAPESSGQAPPKLAVLDFGSVIHFSSEEAEAVQRLLLGDYLHEDELIEDLLISGLDRETVEVYRPIISDLVVILLEPFYYPGSYDFFNWRLQYKINTLLSSKTWERPLAIPLNLLLLLRTLQGIYYYARVNFISFNWQEAVRKYMR